MHKDELWQVYAPNGEPISGVGWNPALDDTGKMDTDTIVGVAVMFLYRLNNEGKLELLWQKRADSVGEFPGYYDFSAGGHIDLGETVTEGAIRECREEIGAEIKAEDLQFAFLKPFNKKWFAWVFMVDWTGREDDFRFNDNEVSEVKWVLYSDNEKFRKKYAKPMLAKDDLTFACLDSWLRIMGLTDGDL